MTDFDMDPRASSFEIGIELEWPVAPSEDERFTAAGRRSGDIRSAFRDRLSLPVDGQAVGDGTVGLEVVSGSRHRAIELGDAPKWYADVIDYVENEAGTLHSPCGLIAGGSTAGLHLHLSPLSRDQARALYEISTTTWGRALFCSSIADDINNWSVFRGGRYCRFNGFGDSSRYNAVNDRGDGHYEWRLPEPVTPEHFELVIKFLRLFEQDIQAAIQFGQELLDNADDRITSIRRAEEVGIDMDGDATVARRPADTSPDFYEAVANAEFMPEIYRVLYDGTEYYAFQSRLEAEFEVPAFGIEIGPDTVVEASSLDRVEDEEVVRSVLAAFQQQDGDPTKSDATDFVKEIVKKKKGAV